MAIGKGNGAGRPSKLTPEQWDEVIRRVTNGESMRRVAESSGISEKRIRSKIKDLNIAGLAQKKAANDLAAEEIRREIGGMLPAAQDAVNTLAGELKAISEHMAAAAHFSARSAHRLSMIANLHLDKMDEANPLDAESARVFSEFVALQKGATLAAEIPTGLMTANKETIKKINDEGEQPPTPTAIVFSVVDATAEDADA